MLVKGATGGLAPLVAKPLAGTATIKFVYLINNRLALKVLIYNGLDRMKAALKSVVFYDPNSLYIHRDEASLGATSKL